MSTSALKLVDWYLTRVSFSSYHLMWFPLPFYFFVFGDAPSSRSLQQLALADNNDPSWFLMIPTLYLPL